VNFFISSRLLLSVLDSFIGSRGRQLLSRECN